MEGEGDHLQFRERAAHAVAVDHGNAGHRADHERDGGIETSRFGAQDRADRLAEEPLELSERDQDLLALRDLFDHDRRRAHHRAGDDEGVVIERVHIDHPHRAEFADRLLRHQLADIGIAAAAGAENRAADGDVVEIGDADHPLRRLFFDLDGGLAERRHGGFEGHHEILSSPRGRRVTLQHGGPSTKRARRRCPREARS